MKNIKSLKFNAILNTLKQLCAVVFPLITIPHVSRVLEENNYGRYNFANSIICYFTLFAGLGILSYAVREGARLRNDIKAFRNFVNQVFSINVISTLLSYIILFVGIELSTKFSEYSPILLVLSISIFCTTIGTEWLNAIQEDYISLTIEYIVFQIISLILLFIFVKTPNDIVKYAAIVVLSSGGANVVNAFYVKRKYGGVKLVLEKDMLKHIIPIIVLFFNTLAVTIYVNSDVTMLGYIKTDVDVGVYSIASKIYLVIKQILNATVAVSFPRFSAYIGINDMKKYKEMIQKVLHSLLILLLPICSGMYIFSSDLIVLISSKNYIEGEDSLKILAVALFFSVLASFFSSCVALPLKKDKTCLIASVISAIVNILLNFVLIPYWSYNGAAFTTLIAELLVMIILYKNCTLDLKISIDIKIITKILGANFFLILICIFTKIFVSSNFWELLLSVFMGGFGYFLMLYLLKDAILCEVCEKIFRNEEMK